MIELIEWIEDKGNKCDTNFAIRLRHKSKIVEKEFFESINLVFIQSIYSFVEMTPKIVNIIGWESSHWVIAVVVDWVLKLMTGSLNRTRNIDFDG